MKLGAARIFVFDLAQAHRFYGAQLGLPLSAGGVEHGYCVYAPGGIELVVETVARDAPDDDQALVGRFTGLSFAVTSIHDVYDRLVAQGVVFTGTPAVQPWGGVLATLRDPAGNLLQLVEAPRAA